MQFLSGSAMPDFHASPGAASGGRSVTAQPYDGRQLGDWLHRLRPPLETISLAGMGIAGGADMAHFSMPPARRAPRCMPSAACCATAGSGCAPDEGSIWSMAMRWSPVCCDPPSTPECAFSSMPRWSGCCRVRRVCPARVLRSDSGEIHVEAGAVVLACGGFPHDRQRLAQVVPHAAEGYGHFSAAPPDNQGEGIRLGESVGGQFDTRLRHPLAWAPVSRVTLASGQQLMFPHLVERAKPGVIAVLPNGKRFVNEADSYHDFITALLAATPAGDTPQAWLLADRRALRRYGLGHARPFPFTPHRLAAYRLPAARKHAGELAKQCAIDAYSLVETVERFNHFASTGEDVDFHRGASAYNRAQGDHQVTLGPLREGPFYAVRILPGSLGTFSGLQTDEHARVLDGQQQPIPGLFAIGNDMSSVMRGYYPSGGITLGPAMTFGYLVGKNLAGNTIKTKQ